MTLGLSRGCLEVHGCMGSEFLPHEWWNIIWSRIMSAGKNISCSLQKRRGQPVSCIRAGSVHYLFLNPCKSLVHTHSRCSVMILSKRMKANVKPTHSLSLALLSHIRLFETLQTVDCWAPLSMGFSREEYWIGLSFPSLGDLLDLGIKCRFPMSPALQEDYLPAEPLGKPSIKPLETATCWK